MKASTIEFRLRMVIMIAIVALGFWSPWIEMWGIGRRISLLGWLPLELSRLGPLSFTVASSAVIVLGALVAAVGVVLRVWGTAYLGYGTVHHGQMQASVMMADGPYRYVRNPLYLGGWCMMAAMSLIMPPTGALFAMTLLTVFFLRLILGEEAFLASQFGEPYRDYLRAVPRLVPRLRAGLPSAGHKPHWLTALLSELNPIGVFITLAFLSWSYDHVLMLKAILISFGASLVVRAVMPRIRQESAEPE
ncbi:MAG: isoprenylcysteine carboxylmethyltransferase family protein [Terracidiphilus sp.]|nr:isoprenylcysteine carboxylmethyltransferase family protein [Terracidiphilus sp.]